MKKYLLFFAVLFAITSAKAQTGFDNDEWGIGADGGYIIGYTNLKKQVGHPALSVSGIYNAFLPIAADLQIGRLSGGGETPATDFSGRYYSNNYIALMVHADFQLSSVVNYLNSDLLNDIKGFYAGAGGGFIFNHNKVQRYNQYPQNGPVGSTNGFQGKDKSISPTVTIRLGYEFKFWDSYNQQTMAIDLGINHYYAFGEGLDGYNDPHPPFQNLHTSQYTQFMVGFRYYFTTGYLP